MKWNIFKAKNEAIEKLKDRVSHVVQHTISIEQGCKAEIKALKAEVWDLQNRVIVLETRVNILENGVFAKLRPNAPGHPERYIIGNHKEGFK